MEGLSSLQHVGTTCIYDHLIRREHIETEGELSPECAHIALKSVYLANLGRPDFRLPVKALARSVTKMEEGNGRLRPLHNTQTSLTVRHASGASASAKHAF